MVTAVLFAFRRQNCKLVHLRSLVAHANSGVKT
jgi:hypothetical protein